MEGDLPLTPKVQIFSKINPVPHVCKGWLDITLSTSPVVSHTQFALLPAEMHIHGEATPTTNWDLV